MSTERMQAELDEARADLLAAERKLADMEAQVSTAKRMRETQPEQVQAPASALVAALRAGREANAQALAELRCETPGGLDPRPIG